MTLNNSKNIARGQNNVIKSLYERPIQSTRGGPLFNACPYPTKISPESIALFIATHTKPGATIFDGFAGSGSTGIAAILCSNPTDKMKSEAKKLGLSVQWGARRAVLYEISVMGSLISKVLCSPPDPSEFRKAANQLLENVEKKLNRIYEIKDPEGKKGNIRYIVWSDLLQCPSCKESVTLWSACVSRKPAQISNFFKCPSCGYKEDINKINRIYENVKDGLLGKNKRTRIRKPAWIYGKTGNKFWSRQATQSDLRAINKINKTPLPANIPKVAIPWGDLYRSGYHEGITHLHHFYTRRNLLVFASLWSEIEKFPVYLQDALRFLLLSYNAAHSTIMTRVVAKKGQNDLVVTSAQPGVLYISGLPVEKNIFSGIERKIDTIYRAFKITHRKTNFVEVHNSSSLSVDLPDKSIDYVFTDPPFGGNIPYAEVNFINEAWLGKSTNSKEEAIISPHQRKTVENYQKLLSKAFQEAYRLLRSKANATIIFHSSSAQVWNAMRDACQQAGFFVTNTNVLDKTQSSFKQVKSPGAVKGDQVILLSKKHSGSIGETKGVRLVISELFEQAMSSKDPVEISPQRLYSRFVGHFLTINQNVPINAGDFYRVLKRNQVIYETQRV